jgi:hypothetical protein
MKKQPFGSILPPSRLMVKEATADTPLIVLSTRKDACQVCHEDVFLSFFDYIYNKRCNTAQLEALSA